MTMSLLYGCCQIETSARDLAAVRRFMMEVLGAVPAEQELAQQIAALIPGDEYDVDHLDCGEVIFQINQPSAAMEFNGQKSIHQDYLDRAGSSVTNLNYYVDDHAHAHALLEAMGARTHIEGPSNVAAALGDYGPENTRAGGGDRPFLFMGSRHLIGFDLEIMEPNFLRVSRQTAQFPAYVQPRPCGSGGELKLKRLVVAVEDLERTHANLCQLFSPGSRSKTYDIRAGALGKSFRIGLGGMEIEYCQPSGAQGDLAAFLASHGAGVMAVVFRARDPEEVLNRARSEYDFTTSEPPRDLLGLALPGAFHHIACRALTGFDVMLESWDEATLATP
jgi:hypothetical protein